MQPPNAIDATVLRRHDRLGPRYTSYPTAQQFTPKFGEDALREAIRESNGDPIPRLLSVHVDVPFCRNPCFYCGCSRIIARDRTVGDAYVARVHREIAMTAAMFDRDREVEQIHFGGGTPNFLSPDQLRDIVDMLKARFRVSEGDGHELSIELDPRALSVAEVGELAAIGFNGASLVVQDFDRGAQEAVNRVQSVDQTLAIIAACRRAGMRSASVDLIYGLPRQTPEGFAATLDTVVAARPDRLAVYGYAHLPELFKAQQWIGQAELPPPEVRLALLELAIHKLTSAGYVYIGMDHFTLPDDALARARACGTLHRSLMGYTTHADSDLVGVGVSAISHIGATYSQNSRDLTSWQDAIDAGRLPICRGLRLSTDDQIRAELIQRLMCNAEISTALFERRYSIEFGDYFREDLVRLKPLVEDGLVCIEADRIFATSQGRLFLRSIAMCFDRYLVGAGEPIRFSRVV